MWFFINVIEFIWIFVYYIFLFRSDIKYLVIGKVGYRVVRIEGNYSVRVGIWRLFMVLCINFLILGRFGGFVGWVIVEENFWGI